MDTTLAEQNKPGTLADSSTKESPPTGDQPSSAQKEPSPSQGPKTHTGEEVERAVKLARMDAGRLTVIAEKERDAFKSQLANKTSELEDIQAERDNLDKRIEELSSSDPELNSLEKLSKDLRERERQLKEGNRALDTEKQANQERVQLVESTLREITIWEIATEYQGSDPVKLKDLADTFEAKSEEQIRKVADTLWEKPGAIVPYSGLTRGGAEDLSKLTARELLELGEKKRGK